MENQTFRLKLPYLKIEWPDGRVEEYNLKGNRTAIGRQPETNQGVVPKDFSSVSRNHFEILQEGFNFRVVDLNSTNGVFLNSVRVNKEAELEDSDTITFGEKDKSQQVRIQFFNPVAEVVEQISAPPEASRQDVSALVLDQPPQSDPYLKVRWLTGKDSFIPVTSERMVFGRDDTCDFQFPPGMRFTSGDHFEIRRAAAGLEITDLDSTNGTLLNGRALSPNMPASLQNGDVIRIGDEAFGVSIGFYFFNPVEDVPAAGFSFVGQAPQKVDEKVSLLIGRHPDCDLVIDSPKVSRWHARVEGEDGTFWLTDLDSLNGTFLNGRQITRAQITEGDQIQIGSQIITFQDEQLNQFDSYGMRVDVIGLTKDYKKRQGTFRVLHGISLTVLPREFIAIVGGSGAGKSTLMNALNGANPADGQVILNGHDFYEEYDLFRGQIGFVPQSDILHTSLTVGKALDYAARLRLPPDTSPEEREARIQNVLDTVNMGADYIRTNKIKNLSGGQRKRISIAAELLADPKLLYLDEPTSGLDPGLEKKMMHTLRHMADQGRTVVLITHATANIRQVDQVAFISQGRLVYYGPPDEALEYFGVEEFADIYERIERQGETWQKVFTEEKPRFYQRYVLDRQKNKFSSLLAQGARKVKFGIGQFFRQLGVLTRRALNIQASDLVTLGLLAALYPFTALLQLLIATPDVLVGDPLIMADPVAAARTLAETYAPLVDTRIFVFITGLEAVLIGMYVPSNELILERSVYLRERMVNLRILPYLLSKVLVFSLFALIQCVLYLIVLSLGVDFPDQGLFMSAAVEIFITVLIAMIASICIGLFVSSIAKSPEMAMYMLVMLLFFQFFFAGIIFNLEDKPAQPLSYFTVTRWSMIGLGVTVDLEKVAESTILCTTLSDNPLTPQVGDEITTCEHYPEAKDDLLLPYNDENLAISWGVMAAFGLVFFALTGFSVKRLDRT